MDAPAMSPQDVRIYYTRPEILAEILRMCKDREVIPVFAGGYMASARAQSNSRETFCNSSGRARCLSTVLSSTGGIPTH